MIQNKEQLTKNQALEWVHGIVSLVYFLYLVVITVFVRIFMAMFVLDVFFELVLTFLPYYGRLFIYTEYHTSNCMLI